MCTLFICIQTFTWPSTQAHRVWEAYSGAMEWVYFISAWFASVCCGESSYHCLQTVLKYIQVGWEEILPISDVCTEWFFCAYVLTFYEISSSTGYRDGGKEIIRKPVSVRYRKASLKSQAGKRNRCVKACRDAFFLFSFFLSFFLPLLRMLLNKIPW